MAFDRQGNLPGLGTMSKVELKDLLSRQEKILANKRFLRTLPDKGKKIETFANKLREVIKEKEDVENTAQLFEKMDLGASCIAEGGVVERIPQVTLSNQDKQPQESDDIQAKSVPNVFLKTDTNVKKKEPFLPYKSLKSTEIPKDLPKPNVQPMKVARGSSTVEHRSDDDFSAAKPPLLKHETGTKTVELDQSAQLLETQKKKVDDLLAQQAAQKLAERMHIKLDTYTPASTDMRYRDPIEDDDEDEDEEEDSDDDDDEVDNDNEQEEVEDE